MKEFIKKNWRWIILFICIISFLLIAENLFNKEIIVADIVGHYIILNYFRSDFTTELMKFITNFGGALFLISSTIILLLVIKNKKIGIYIFFNLICATFINLILKNILQRPRPIDYRFIDESRV